MSSTALRRFFSKFAFVFLSSLLVVTASERVYWYLGGLGFEANIVIALFYMIPTLVMLWVVGSGPSQRLHQVILGGAVFGFVVEGVLTTVIYEDGPLPVLAALFVGWHGLLSVVAFWYLARKWLLERRRSALATGSALIGAYWGIWSIVYRLPESTEDFEESFAVMEPGEFAVYALGVGAIFAIGHWLIGYVWPDDFRLSKWGRRGTVALVAGYGSLAVLVFVPWAPAKLAVLIGTALWLLRRSRTTTSGEPSAVAALQGRVALRDVLILMIAPLVAGAAYAGVWAMDLTDDSVEGLMALLVATQVVAGLVAFGWAARRSLRGSQPSEVFDERTVAP